MTWWSSVERDRWYAAEKWRKEHNHRREERTMSTKDQLEAMRAEIESHVENLRQLRKAATAEDASDDVLTSYGEAIKFGTWMAEDIRKIVDRDESWPEPDGLRYGDGRVIPTSR